MGRNRRRQGGNKQAATPAPRTAARRLSRPWLVAAFAVAVLGSVWALRSTPSPQASPASPASVGVASGSQPVVRSLRVDVLRELSHERDAYTQGLVWWNQQLFESTGRSGESSLRRLDPQTGRVEQRIDLPDEYFGEGLALVARRLLMLTWTAGRAFTYDRDSFEQGETFEYQGEGWGLCHDGDRLVMSDGSDRLTFRDPDSFEPIGEQRVRLRGQPLDRLNELECVDGAVYANVWERDFLVRINPETGRVTDYIDATGLLQGADRVGAEVLNGIAYNPTSETFFITGKWWPKMFEVRFVE